MGLITGCLVTIGLFIGLDFSAVEVTLFTVVVVLGTTFEAVVEVESLLILLLDKFSDVALVELVVLFNYIFSTGGLVKLVLGLVLTTGVLTTGFVTTVVDLGSFSFFIIDNIANIFIYNLSY